MLRGSKYIPHLGSTLANRRHLTSFFRSCAVAFGNEDDSKPTGWTFEDKSGKIRGGMGEISAGHFQLEPKNQHFYTFGEGVLDERGDGD